MLAFMLGPFAYASARGALHDTSTTTIAHLLNNHSLLRETAVESGMMAALFFYLRWRGWRPADLKIRINLTGTLLMPVIAVGASLANGLVTFGLTLLVLLLAPHPHGLQATFLQHAPHTTFASSDLAWSVIVVASFVNAYLEELTFMSYGFNQFAARCGPLFALLVMVFLRMLLHTYKGPLNMIGIGAFSFVFGMIYLYGRRLWPLIFAHACIDLFAFSLFKILFGR